ncbi:D-sedoheptulose-7-phosphate isomerase [Butyrivibrio fibrisolvens]|uniref:D-sedoheptulose-7-phosphate isomerase n=1 Tax=Butyrivibrio fibrisolvens TaxID=831 RepID=UPI0004177CD3|nr:D-sedoheptulose 7-phosphate isomerase [Butyrivibrio fibrisolvens]
MSKWITDIIAEKKELLDELEKCGYLKMIDDVGECMISSLKNGGRIILAGNGGSAADAQHFAGEIVGRFLMERESLPAISLCTDPSVVTCIANDYGYEEVFSRQLSGNGKKGDVFVGISTSGNSENIIRAIEVAHKKGITVVGLLGKDGGKIKDMCDYALVVPSKSTPRIQEIHTFSVHLLCEMIEKGIF